MSFWAEDPELFLHKGQDGVVHVLRCKKETTTSSSSSMLMKPEDFTDELAVTDLKTLTGGRYDWDTNKYKALIDYIYPRHLLVNCHGSVIVELEPDEKNKKATAVVYMRALGILDMGSYGPGPDHPGQAVPAKTVKYLQDGTVAQTEPTSKEMKLAEELAIKIKEIETLQQELQSAKEQIDMELAKENKLIEELAIKCKEVETLQQQLLLLLKKNTVRIHPMQATDCSLTIRNGYHTVLGSNNEFDVCQYWVKDYMYGATVKNSLGFPSYALVNKFTGQALKPSNSNGHLELVPFDQNVLDKCILWTENDSGDINRTINKATDTSLTMDASADGAISNANVGDGTNVGLWTWWGGYNQHWNFTTYC